MKIRYVSDLSYNLYTATIKCTNFIAQNLILHPTCLGNAQQPAQFSCEQVCLASAVFGMFFLFKVPIKKCVEHLNTVIVKCESRKTIFSGMVGVKLMSLK